MLQKINKAKKNNNFSIMAKIFKCLNEIRPSNSKKEKKKGEISWSNR